LHSRIHPKVVAIPWGCGFAEGRGTYQSTFEGNVNALTDDASLLCDPHFGTNPRTELLCRLTKDAEDPDDNSHGGGG
jgi:hypothetical protein